MPKLKLTKKSIDALPHPASGQVFHRDSELRGFGICVGARDKSYFVERQILGRTRRVTLGRFPVMQVEDARGKALEVLAAMARGENPVAEAKAARSGVPSVKQAFANFFEGKPNLAEVTVSNYSRTPTRYLKDWLNKPLDEITKEMVMARHRKISDEFGPPTANNVFRHFRSVYNFAASLHDDLPPNPVHVLSRTRSWAKEKRRRTIVAAHQLPAWWRVVHNETFDARDFLMMALFTGMRRNEIAKLRWDYVDLIARTLHIPTTKNGDPLILPLSDFLTDLLQHRRETTGASEWVFPGTGMTGHLVETKTFVARIVKASGVAFSLHDMRRTFITIAESLDIPAYALKRLLNHRADGDVTGGYIVMSVERLRGPVERIAAKIMELADAGKF